MLQCGCVGIDSSPANDDRLLWLWEEVDVLCPSIYPRTKPFNASAEAQSVNATVAEAVRAAELVRTLRTARGDARPPPAVMPSVLSPYSPTPFRILFEYDCAHFSGIQTPPFSSHDGRLLLTSLTFYPRRDAACTVAGTAERWSLQEASRSTEGSWRVRSRSRQACPRKG